MPYYRRNLYILSVTIFLASVSWNQVIPFLPRFLQSMGADDVLRWIGIVFAAQAGASMLAQPFWGKLGDSYGRKPMILRAGICLTGVYFGMSICHAPWQLAALRFLNGALTGFIPGSFALIATNTPEQLAPKSVATAQAASAAGLILGPALGGQLASMIGYRGSMQVSGLAVMIATILVWVLVKEPNKVAPTEKTSLAQDFRMSLRSPVLSSLMFVAVLTWAFGASIAPIFALYLHALDERATDFVVGILYALPSAALLLLARRWTGVGERIGFDRTIIIGLAGSGVATLALVAAPGVWSFAALYFVAGIWLAAIGPSTGAVTCTLVEQTFRGRAYGMQQAAGTFGALIAPLAATQIGAAFGMRAIFVFVGVLFLGGVFVFRGMINRWPAAEVEPIADTAVEETV